MTRAILVPAELGGAALSELKAWLAITTNSDDDYLLTILASAHEACEIFTGAMPLAQNCEDSLLASSRWQNLSARPVVAVTAVEGITASGSRIALDPTSYESELEPGGLGRVRIIGPTTAIQIAVRYVAGSAPGWGSVSPAIKQGIIRLAAHLYRERDGADPMALPASVSALWRPFRIMRLV